MHTKAKGQWGRSGPTTSFPKLLGGLSVCEAGRARSSQRLGPAEDMKTAQFSKERKEVAGSL